MTQHKPIVLVYSQPVTGLAKRFGAMGFEGQRGEVPLGLLYLAGELERAGFEVIVRDNSLESRPNDELADEIVGLEPLLVGFSVNVFNTQNTRDVARLVKQGCPETKIAFGGPHVTVMPEEHAALQFVDFVITHQGEITLRKIAGALRDKGFPAPEKPQDKILRGEAPASLDELALPARHLINMQQYPRRSYVLDVVPTDNVCSSRGCPFRCAFCSSKTFWEKKYFRRSPKLVIDEIELLIRDYGSKAIYFREDNFTVNPGHVRGISEEMIHRNLNIPWECESRVDSLSRDMLELMKKAGCAGIWAGVESGSPRVLKSILKDIDVEQVRGFFKDCAELDIAAGACFMIGFPDETSDDLRRTFELAVQLPTKWVEFVAYIGFPRSELYEHVVAHALWEDRWEDVLVVRNERFSAQQLYQLERAMNRDAKRLKNKQPLLTAGESVETFEELLLRFENEKHRSIVSGITAS